MSDIERTCHHIRAKRYRRAAERIASDNFENGFLHQQTGMQHAIVDYIAQRLKNTHKDLRRKRYPILLTSQNRTKLVWETYHKMIDELHRNDDAGL